jgi:hypothetical protein
MPRPRSELLILSACALALAASCERKKPGGEGAGGGADPLPTPPPPEAAPLPELEPGQMPLGFAPAPLSPGANTRVLFVRQERLREAAADDLGAPALSWVAGSLDATSDDGDATVRPRRADGSLADPERVPAGVVVPMGPHLEVSPGTLVLTHDARGRARRALVVPGGMPDAPSARLLDDDLETGPVSAPVSLEVGSFRPISADTDPGAWVATSEGDALVPGRVVARSGDALLLRGFGGALRTAPASDARAASRTLPEVGDPVLAPYLGRYLEATVASADPDTGRVDVTLRFLGDEVRSTHGVGTLLPR